MRFVRCRFVKYSYIYEACMSPALSGSSAIRRLEGNNLIEIRGGITFDSYTDLPHMQSGARGPRQRFDLDLYQSRKKTQSKTPFMEKSSWEKLKLVQY